MLKDIRMTISGNVTRDPEVKYRRSDGRPFAVVPIAVNERRFDPGSQQFVQAGVTYYDIICSGSLGANALHSLSVGLPVVAHGRFSVHEWTSENARGARPQVRADSLGIDLTWGTTSYTKGSRSYPGPEPEFATAPPPAAEGGPVRLPGGGPDDPGAEHDDPELEHHDPEQDLPPGTRVDEDGVVHDAGPGPEEEDRAA